MIHILIVEGINSELHLIISNSHIYSDKSGGKRLSIPTKDIACVRDAFNIIVERMAGINRIQINGDDILVPDMKDDKRKE